MNERTSFENGSKLVIRTKRHFQANLMLLLLLLPFCQSNHEQQQQQRRQLIHFRWPTLGCTVGGFKLNERTAAAAAAATTTFAGQQLCITVAFCSLTQPHILSPFMSH